MYSTLHNKLLKTATKLSCCCSYEWMLYTKKQLTNIYKTVTIIILNGLIMFYLFFCPFLIPLAFSCSISSLIALADEQQHRRTSMIPLHKFEDLNSFPQREQMGSSLIRRFTDTQRWIVLRKIVWEEFNNVCNLNPIWRSVYKSTAWPANACPTDLTDGAVVSSHSGCSLTLMTQSVVMTK